MLSALIARNERNKIKHFINSHKHLFYNNKVDSSKWKKKWSELGKTNDIFYRYYSKYIGEDTNILPDDLMHNVIEPILNPMRFRGLYADKNMFDKLLKPYFKNFVTPRTLVRCINGGLYDERYFYIDNTQASSIIQSSNASFLVAKPSIDSSSGNSVLFFRKKDDVFVLDKTNTILNIASLSIMLGYNYIIQEGLVQSEEMKQFNPSSINTLRIATYKSVVNEKANVLNAVLRIGKAGASVDNLHAGGCMVGIDSEGKLRSFCSDQYGNMFTEFNGISFDQHDFYIPNFEIVKDFAQRVAACIPHQRVLALDIMLDKDNQPKLIEYNNCAFSVWVFQQTIGTVFGEYTEEVINYCKEHRKEATRLYLTY